MKVAVVNDCSRGGHFGCELVMEAFRHLLEKNRHKVVGTYPKSNKLKMDLTLAAPDLVIVNAEGSIHHNRNLQLLDIAKEFPSILMNGVWQANTEGLERLGLFKEILMRESFSASEVRLAGFNCEVLPDVFLCAPTLVEAPPPKLELARTITDSSLDKLGGHWLPFLKAPEALFTLGLHRGVACGRFHAALACAAMGIPFSVYPANTWKNSALMHDMRLRHLFFGNRTEAMAGIPTSPEDRLAQRRLASRYVERARQKIEDWFGRL